MRTSRGFLVLGFAALIIAACSSSSKSAVAPPPTRATSTTRAPASTTTLRPATKPLAAQGPAYVYKLAFDGRARDYRLHVPPAAGSQVRLVLNLHGDTQNGQLEELQTGMDASSDRDVSPSRIPTVPASPKSSRRIPSQRMRNTLERRELLRSPRPPRRRRRLPPRGDFDIAAHTPVICGAPT
jgi:hypothetical protein